MATVTEKTIDIDVILKDKMGSKAKFVPGILVNWLKRIIHQDQVNAFLWESRDKTGVEWLEECVRYLDMTLEIAKNTLKGLAHIHSLGLLHNDITPRNIIYTPKDLSKTANKETFNSR